MLVRLDAMTRQSHRYPAVLIDVIHPERGRAPLGSLDHKRRCAVFEFVVDERVRRSKIFEINGWK
jgi:hypothetical protein